MEEEGAAVALVRGLRGTGSEKVVVGVEFCRNEEKKGELEGREERKRGGGRRTTETSEAERVGVAGESEPEKRPWKERKR